MNAEDEGEGPIPKKRSRFTFRDLRLLERSSSLSPLRVIALVDFDCFYAQCESVRLGLTEDQPLGVQQFLHVICINYAARAAGLPKVLTAVEAKEKCPEIVLQHVPTWRAGDETWAYRDDVLEHMQTDKSSLDYYRLQSRLAFSIVEKELPTRSKAKVEKAGIDEFFVDLSSHVHHTLLQRYAELVVDSSESIDTLLPRPPPLIFDWHCDSLVEDKDDSSGIDWDDVALSIGAEIVQGLRQRIYEQLQYTCSGGVARNKVLAKLAAGKNKPNKQTVIRNSGIPHFLSDFRFRKLRGLGGKLGTRVSTLFATEQLSDLLPISLSTMQSELGLEAGQWVFHLIRGIDHSAVTSRTQIQSMMSQKTFSPGLKNIGEATSWLRIFVADILGRMEDEDGRRPTVLSVNHAIRGRFGPMHSKQAGIPWGAQLDSKCLMSLAQSLLQKISDEHPSWPCQALSICVSNFKDQETASGSIITFLTPKKRILSLDDSEGVADSTLFEQKKLKKSAASLDNGLLEPAVSIDDGTKFEERQYSTETTLNPLEMYTCPKCTESISADDVLEHLDWHFAKDLQDTS